MCCCKVTHSVFFPFAKLCFIYQHAHEVTRVAAAAAAAAAAACRAGVYIYMASNSDAAVWWPSGRARLHIPNIPRCESNCHQWLITRDYDRIQLKEAGYRRCHSTNSLA